MTKQYEVQIIQHGTDEVVKRIGPMDLHRAERVDGGANINLNHEQFYTLIREATN